MDLQTFTKSYKTSGIGILAGLLNLYANGSSGKEIAFSGTIALLGLLAKDANVTMSQAGTVAKTVDENKKD